MVTDYKKQTDSYLEVKERQAKLNNFLIAQNIIKLLIVSLIALNIYISSYQLLTWFRFARIGVII